MVQLTRDLPRDSYIIGVAGRPMGFGGGNLQPVGNPYVWVRHKYGKVALRETLATLFKNSENVFYIGPNRTKFLNNYVKVELFKRLDPYPMHRVFPVRKYVFDVYKISPLTGNKEKEKIRK